ncbi:MAG TPA: hypothetical protein VNN73_19495 [Blastocatellia bacterium]|nr:hypothetical protein [Blastocatellia bacterium]
MTPERHKQIGELYHRALELEPDRRAGFLDRACGGDDDLRREIESLLASNEEAASFLASPAMKVAARMLAEGRLDSKMDRRVKRYRIISLLGAGGMGEVYLAEDTKLGRRVALKLLPAAFVRDAERLRRFEREARAAPAQGRVAVAKRIANGAGRRLLSSIY